jgi:hypothetical protein
MGFCIFFFLHSDFIMRLIYHFTQVDGHPAASASANVDAPIAEEPDVEAAAVEAEAVCVFGIYLQITAHHLILIGLASLLHDFMRSNCCPVCLSADNMPFSFAITPLSIPFDWTTDTTTLYVIFFSSFLEVYSVSDISILDRELFQSYQCLKIFSSRYRCLQSPFY